MRRVLLIFLSLVLVLVGWTTVCADDGFYVVAGQKAKFAPVPKTGLTTSYEPKDDGDLEKGVPWPAPRFTDNGNGTVTDKLTGLIWLKNANRFGLRDYFQALSDCNGLASGSGNLADGSKAGDWRLPNLRELQSLIDYAFYNPALSNTMGTSKWAQGDPFQGVQPSNYWSSTTAAEYSGLVWAVNFIRGELNLPQKPAFEVVDYCYVWPVRGGK
jgi:hypothetical protein